MEKPSPKPIKVTAEKRAEQPQKEVSPPSQAQIARMQMHGKAKEPILSLSPMPLPPPQTRKFRMARHAESLRSHPVARSIRTRSILAKPKGSPPLLPALARRARTRPMRQLKIRRTRATAKATVRRRAAAARRRLPKLQARAQPEARTEQIMLSRTAPVAPAMVRVGALKVKGQGSLMAAARELDRVRAAVQERARSPGSQFRAAKIQLPLPRTMARDSHRTTACLRHDRGFDREQRRRTRNFGVFADQRVFTVYIPMKRSPEEADPTWTLQYGLMNDDSMSASDDQQVLAPSPVMREWPQVPADLLKKYAERQVVIYAIVDKDGKVSQVAVKKTPDRRVSDPSLRRLPNGYSVPHR